jgi:O-antigen ligase
MFLYRYPTDPNHLACFTVLGFLIALKKFFYPVGGEKARLYGLCALCILTATLLTGSRMAFIAVVIGGLILTTRDLKKFFLLIIFLLAAFAVLPDVLTDRLLYDSYNDGSNSARIFLWRQAWKAIQLHPLIGYGPIDSKLISTFGAAHNTLLSMLLYFGFIGTSCIAVILSKITLHILSADMRLFLSIFAAMIFMSAIIENTVTMPFWFSLIFILWSVNLKRQNRAISLWERI